MENPIIFTVTLDTCIFPLDTDTYWKISTKDKRANHKSYRAKSADVPKKMAYITELYNAKDFSVLFEVD